MKSVRLSDGREVPALGQGTWRMGEDRRQRAQEIQALRAGIDLGLTLIDTAEMYGDGGAEEEVGEAIAGRREEVFIVSKVLPSNATRRGTAQACERSLRRLRIECIDLYLLHWRGSTPLADSLEALTALKQAGKIAAFGVSNFDVDDLEEAWQLAPGQIATNQVLYNLSRRAVEQRVLPLCRRHAIPLMAYSPVEQGRLLGHPQLGAIAHQRAVTPAQIALAWLLDKSDVIAIPKAAQLSHLKENRAAAELVLSDQERDALDRAFPVPRQPRSLEML
ncbi:MAG TPA: aldo/keto reductase [Candidatus Binataceae bacterium]|nr:aldo/keto reductase [Candidatus Binataceae bacterium]